MVALDAVVRVHTRVVLGVGEHIPDRTDQCLRLIGGDLLRSSVLTEDPVEEPACCGTVTAGRDEDVDHLAVLVYGPVHVTPDAGDTDVGLVDEAAATDRVAARAGGVDQLRGETLHPPKDRDVVNGDAAFGEEFLDIAVGEPEAQVPAYGQQDDVGREPVAGEGRPLGDDGTDGGDEEISRRQPHPKPSTTANATGPSGSSSLPGQVLALITAIKQVSSGEESAARTALRQLFTGSVDGRTVSLTGSNGTGVPNPNRWFNISTQAHPGSVAPLGWVLSTDAKNDLRAQLAINAELIRQVRELLDGTLACG